MVQPIFLTMLLDGFYRCTFTLLRGIARINFFLHFYIFFKWLYLYKKHNIYNLFFS